jgi:hypothetical protein
MRGRIVVIALLTFPLILLLIFCLLPGLVGYCIESLRPRPMFCNNRVANDRSVFPRWEPDSPCHDEHGHVAWADFKDNVLVIQATGKAELSGPPAYQFGRQSSRFGLGGDRRDFANIQYVTIPRMRDTLVVILPDGQWERFPLGPDLAREFHWKCAGEWPPNLLRDAGTLLSEEDQVRFDAFLAGYKEPAAEAGNEP